MYRCLVLVYRYNHSAEERELVIVCCEGVLKLTQNALCQVTCQKTGYFKLYITQGIDKYNRTVHPGGRSSSGNGKTEIRWSLYNIRRIGTQSPRTVSRHLPHKIRCEQGLL